MRHRKAGKTLDRNSPQRQKLVRNLALALIQHERIITTAARAKVARSFVEKLITLGKQPSLHHRRQMLASLPNESATKKVLETLGPRYKTRTGGYTRMVKIDPRPGDGAARVVLEFVK